MNTFLPLLLIIFFTAQLSHAASFTVSSYKVNGVSVPCVANRILVRFKPGTSTKKASALFKTMLSTPITGQLLPERVELVTIPEGKTVNEMIEEYKKNPNVEWAEPDYILRKHFVPNDLHNNQWNLRNTGQSITISSATFSGVAGADIKMVDAWDITTGSEKVVISIIDSGIQLNHPDLAANIWVNSDEVANNGKDDDVDGFIDNINGWDFIDNDNDPNLVDLSIDSTSWHGTFVAGIAGAVTNNAVGIAGIAGGNSASGAKGSKLMSLRVCGRDDCPDSAIASAINFAVKSLNVSERVVINMSLGGGISIEVLTLAIDDAISKGAIIVASSGNGGLDGIGDPLIESPAVHPKVISVGASTIFDFRSFFSNFGARLDVVAPGSNVYSSSGSSTYAFGSGTSFSAPAVSGLAALLLAKDPSLTPEELRQIIRLTADDLLPTFLPGWDQFTGWGRVNAYKALTAPKPTEVAKTDIDSFTFPNPYRPLKDGLMKFRFASAKSSNLEIKIYNLAGDLVRTLNSIDGEFSVEQGLASWDGLGEDKQPLVSGLYMYVIKGEKEKTTGRFVVIK